jgi:hypothetical protein
MRSENAGIGRMKNKGIDFSVAAEGSGGGQVEPLQVISLWVFDVAEL